MKIKVGDAGAENVIVIDLDTGEEITYCISANDETGEYTRYQTDEAGKIVWEYDSALIETKVGNIKIQIKENDE